jgi:hypothetical protein
MDQARQAGGHQWQQRPAVHAAELTSSRGLFFLRPNTVLLASDRNLGRLR